MSVPREAFSMTLRPNSLVVMTNTLSNSPSASISVRNTDSELDKSESNVVCLPVLEGQEPTWSICVSYPF